MMPHKQVLTGWDVAIHLSESCFLTRQRVSVEVLGRSKLRNSLLLLKSSGQLLTRFKTRLQFTLAGRNSPLVITCLVAMTTMMKHFLQCTNFMCITTHMHDLLFTQKNYIQGLVTTGMKIFIQGTFKMKLGI